MRCVNGRVSRSSSSLETSSGLPHAPWRPEGDIHQRGLPGHEGREPQHLV